MATTPGEVSEELPPVDVWIHKLDFKSTAEVKIPERLVDQVIGQERAVEVIRKAAEQKRHVMLIGDPGTGKSMLARSMTELLPRDELQDIIVYHNPEDPNEPKIRVVPAGKGREIVNAQKAEAAQRREQKASMVMTIVFFIIGLSVILAYNWGSNPPSFKPDASTTILFGILVAAIGEGWCFFANAVSYIAVIAGLLMMRIEGRFERQERGSAVESVIEGFRFARRTAPVWALLLLVGVVSLVAMPYTVLMPIFADRVLHGGARGLGLLMGATGIGALAGALVLAARTRLEGLGRWVAISAAAFGVTLLAFAFSRWFWISFVVLVPAGFAMMLEMACTNTLLQAMSPDRLRGRVMALYSMMFMGLAPLGSLFAGSVADRIGVAWTVAIGGIVCIASAAWFARRIPSLRAEARQLIVAQQLVGGEPAGATATPRATP